MLGVARWPMGVVVVEEETSAGAVVVGEASAGAIPGEKANNPTMPATARRAAGAAYRALSRLRILVLTYLRRKRQE